MGPTTPSDAQLPKSGGSRFEALTTATRPASRNVQNEPRLREPLLTALVNSTDYVLMPLKPGVGPSNTFLARASLFTLLAAMLAAGSSIGPPAATANENPPIRLGLDPANFPDTVGLYLAGSPRGVSGITPSARAEGWYSQLLQDSTDFAPERVAALRHEVAETSKLVRLWNWGKLFAARLGPVAAGWAGWQIGTVIWGTYIDNDEPIGGNYPANRWFPVAPGQQIFSDGTGEVLAPSWGLAGINSHAPMGRETDTGACEFNLTGPGIRMYAPGWQGATFCGITQFRQYALFRDLAIVRCDVVPCPGITTENYNGNGQPLAPTQTELYDLLEDQLESDGYPLTQRMLNHLAEPEDYPDPRVTQEEHNHSCDRSPGAAYQNPGGNTNPDPFAKYVASPFDVAWRPNGHESTGVYLHWGETYWKPGRSPGTTPWYLDDWPGWGYRHIEAKHGWSYDDLRETEAALLGDLAPIHNGGGQWTYKVPVAGGAGGVGCIRVVGVDFELGPSDPTPRGIVTSFNAVVP